MWGAKPSLNPGFTQELFQRLFINAMNKNEEEFHAKFFDQALLARFIFPYIHGRVLVHDSYHCGGHLHINETKAWPTQRPEEQPLNFVGAVYDSKAEPMLVECPPPCRPKDHQDWIYC